MGRHSTTKSAANPIQEPVADLIPDPVYTVVEPLRHGPDNYAPGEIAPAMSNADRDALLAIGVIVRTA